LAGLAANALLFCVVGLIRQSFSLLLPEGPWVVLLLVFFLGLSVAEMPIMVVALRKLASDPKRSSPTLLAFMNALYVFFAAVYAGMFVLLTGQVWTGAGLSALGFARLVSSLLFVSVASNS